MNEMDGSYYLVMSRYWNIINEEGSQAYINYLLAYHCMPTLLQYKPSSLIRINKKKAGNTEEFLPAIEKVIAIFKCQYTILYENEFVLLFLIYHSDKLSKLLDNIDNEQFLYSIGYNLSENRIENVMNTLRLRYMNYIINITEEHELYETMNIEPNIKFMNKSDLFPHEIGIILGYPIRDVEDYIKFKGRDYILCGFWKVYHDSDNAYKIFRQYKKMREFALSMLLEGKSFKDIRQEVSSIPNFF